MAQDLQIEMMTVGALQTNCYVVSNGGGAAYIIDPGSQPEVMHGRIAALGVEPVAVLLTHAHVDHIGAVKAMVDRYGVPVLMHPRETELYHSPQNAVPPWIPAAKGPLPETVEALDTMPEGLAFEQLSTPGHTSGGISFYFREAEAIFSGDALFQGSIGRTDLPGGDHDVLIASIREQLLVLPESTTVYPGHGPPTTIGREKQYNPYI